MHDLNQAYVKSTACLIQRGQILLQLVYAPIYYQIFLKTELLYIHNKVCNTCLYRQIVDENKFQIPKS